MVFASRVPASSAMTPDGDPKARKKDCEPRRRQRDRDMAKGKKKLEVIHLVCEETGDMNYTLRRKTGGEKLKVKKYSPRLRKHTLHNEKRK